MTDKSVTCGQEGAFNVRRLLSVHRSFLSGKMPPVAYRQSVLVSSLNEVAASVSGAHDLGEVPGIIVDAAKLFTGTEKIVLYLFEDDEMSGSVSTEVFVRGSKNEHLESWWEEWLPRVIERVLTDGRPYVETDPVEGAWVLAVPVRVKDRTLGVLCAINSVKHQLREEQTAFLSILAAFAATSLENAKLAEESRYSLLASERERISREMHDGIAQALFSISLGLEVCKKKVHRNPDAVARQLDEIQDLLGASMGELRRYIYDLRPAKLQELGLVGAIEYWLREITPPDRMKAMIELGGIPRPLSAEVEACLYRVAREAVTNAVKHASPTQVHVRIDYAPDSVTLLVEDDGHGFDVCSATAESESGATVGLRSLHERVRSAGGGLAIDSAPGNGCRLCVRVPC
ncbi:MAG: GAF domain-containing sensor histidine kinase [Coriobacteriia bacterium]|nr:GAF domain-containing sensor histidine kinase [Coriobacteriia bacterium]